MIRPIAILNSLGRFRLWRAGLRHRVFSYQGQKVHYWIGGQGSPLLLVHGIGGSTLQDFRRLAPSLSHEKQIIAVDLPGYGCSWQAQIEQSISAHAKFLKAFLVHLGLEKVDLAGNSMGGWIALKFTHQNPELVGKLILLSSAGVRFEHPPLEIFTPQDREGQLLLLSYLFTKPPKLPNWFLRDWLRTSKKRHQAIREMLASMLTGADLMEEVIGELRHHPTLIIWGAEDRLIPVQTAHTLKKLVPHADLEILPNCGHVPLHENFARVREIISAWLRQ